MWNDSKDRVQSASEEFEYMTPAERIAKLDIEDIATVKGLFFIDQLDDVDRELALDALTGRIRLSPDQQAYFRDQLERHYDRQSKARQSDVVASIVAEQETVGAL